MAFNPFIGWTQPELESALKDAQQEFAEGKSLTIVSAGDGSASKQIQATAMERIRKIYISLNALDPATYPKSAISPITKTYVSFPNGRS